jgi:hypothetical protein
MKIAPLWKVQVVWFPLMMLTGCAHSDDPTGAIERKYFADGLSQPVIAVPVTCFVPSGFAIDMYYQADLATSNALHPIVTWGNGTGGSPTGVAYFLRHLASWGFVVVATQDKYTYSGDSILAALDQVIDASRNNSSCPFYGKLDTSHIAAVGHSQGAGGVIKAMIKSWQPPHNRISTAIPIELPGQMYCFFCPPADVLDTASITQGSVFFVDGSLDPVSPPTQPSSATGEQSIAAFYDAVPVVDSNGHPNGVLKLKGTLRWASHNDITGQPKCTATVPFCDIGVFGYLGYPTAWLAYQLGVDAAAKTAFVSGSGEMFQQSSHWDHVGSNVQ